MSLTVLLDLDDTLISNDMDIFLPAYLKLLGKSMSKYVDPGKLISTLLAATENMVKRPKMDASLEQVFDQAFYPGLGVSKQELLEPLTNFYEYIFPQLKPLTALKPGAVNLVNHLLRINADVVIATNPLFPLRAIEHRIDWAGLASQRPRFRLITSYETFHFGKPHPAYFTEILSRLGWKEQPVVMIGNSLNDDILPAGELGITGFLVSESENDMPSSLPTLSKSGALSEIPAWLESIQNHIHNPLTMTTKGLIDSLRSTPAFFDNLLRSLSLQSFQFSPTKSDWNVIEILCHLRDVDREVNLPRLEKVLLESSPFLAGVISDTWAQERDYKSQDPWTAVQHFVEERAKMIGILEDLTPVQWERKAQHAIFGPTSLYELISFMHTHDRAHIQQAYQISEICFH